MKNPMKRGDIVLMADRTGGDFAGKPRPAVIVQRDSFQATDSVVVCPITSQVTGMPLVRVALSPGPATGLRLPSEVAVEKLTSVRRGRISRAIGQVPERDMLILDRSLAVFLGIA